MDAFLPVLRRPDWGPLLSPLYEFPTCMLHASLLDQKAPWLKPDQCSHRGDKSGSINYVVQNSTHELDRAIELPYVVEYHYLHGNRYMIVDTFLISCKCLKHLLVQCFFDCTAMPAIMSHTRSSSLI